MIEKRKRHFQWLKRYNDALEKFNRYDKKGSYNPDTFSLTFVKHMIKKCILRIERLDYEKTSKQKYIKVMRFSK